jgi:AmpD protein
MAQAAMPTTDTSAADAPAADDGLWQAGWYRFAKALRSPNFGPRPATAPTDLVVLHSISLPPGEYGGDAVQQLFTNQLDWDAHPYFESIRGLQVSSHFFVRRNGELWQFVSCDDRAWHAGVSSWRGRGNCNDDSIGIELEGLEGQCSRRPSTRRSRACAPPSRSTTRSRTSQGTSTSRRAANKTPAPGFDWRLLREHLGWNPQMFPARSRSANFFNRPMGHDAPHLKRIGARIANALHQQPCGLQAQIGLASQAPCGLRQHRPVFTRHLWPCAPPETISPVCATA